MSSFFDELKRRKVYRVAVAYVIAAGGIIQLASAVFPAWELPDWSLRLVIVLLLIGFPIALILAWAFDVTPTGIQATTCPLDQPASAAQRLFFRCGRAGRGGYGRILPSAARGREEGGQIDRGPAVRKSQ